MLLGVALGGFWAMSAAIAMRLVPEPMIPRALSMIFSGVSAAAVFAAPVGSYLGDLLGWRAVFLMAGGLGLAALVAQVLSLPRMAPNAHTSLRTLGKVMARPGVGIGMVSILLVFTGRFALFTYVRPFLETVTGVGVSGVSGILLGFGMVNFAGTYLGGTLLARSMRLTLTVMPLTMGLLGLAALGGSPTVASVLIALWGVAFGAVPVAWSTWITRTVPDEAESAGGLFVAAVQLAIATGAAAGGAIFCVSGAGGVFGASGIVLLLAALVVLGGVRARAVAVAP